MLLPGRIYAEWGVWHFEDFCNIFLLNVGKNQKKKSYHLSAGLLVSGVAATWRFWFCARGDKLQWGGKRRLRSADRASKKKVKQENDLQRGSWHTLKNLKFELLFDRCCVQAALNCIILHGGTLLQSSLDAIEVLQQ